MLEVLMGATALVAVLGMALPRLDGSRHRLDREAASLALLVESVGRLAEHRGYPVAVSFEIVPQRLRVHHDLDGDGRVDAGEETFRFPLRADVAFGTGGAPPLARDADPTGLRLQRDGRPTVVFRSDGTASESGAIHLTARRPAGASPQAADGRALFITASDGSVECLSYRTGSWEATC
jgi:hypothetical protein